VKQTKYSVARLYPRRLDRRSGPSVFWRLFCWLLRERRSGFDRRARPSTIVWVERRRDLKQQPLPIDVECALEHAALVMSKVDPEAHDRITRVIAGHLPAFQHDGADSEGGDTD
jgi:hypothetical protein